ncbi:MAG TPA: hypothetical protein VGP93_20485, partial [Polyangiaceae bacterium]|nr:hypothetical protein [Polyangiaceae bacterium]
MTHALTLAVLASGASACGSGSDADRKRYDSRPAESSLPLGTEWVRAWGGALGDGASDVAVTADAIYVVGSFVGTVDLDPGDGEFSRSTTSSRDPGVTGSGQTSLTKFDLNGNFLWAQALPGPRVNHQPDVAVSESGTVYVAGGFNGSDDFDPGPAEDLHQAPIGGGYYLSAFDPSGAHLFARTWDASVPESSEAEVELATEGGALYILGQLVTTGTAVGAALARLDPDDGSELWAVNLNTNYAQGLSVAPGRVAAALVNPAGIALFGDDGSEIALGPWQSYVEPHAVALAEDGSMYVAGLVHEPFDGQMPDLDPSSAEDRRGAFGNDDAAVIALDPGGDYVWGRLFGGAGGDNARVLTLLPGGALAVSGIFRKSVDFSLGAGSDVREAREADSFVLELNSDGSPRGAFTFGSDGDDWSPAMAPLGADKLLLA